MKKLALGLLFLSLNTNLVSQAYQPFDSTTVWNTLRTGIGTQCYPDVLFSYFIKGYQVTNGYTWYKVYANSSQFKSTYAPLYSSTCTPMSTVITTSFMGLLNNDSLNKKVYFVPNPTLSPNFVPSDSCIEYNFNKSIGDTMWYFNSGVKVPGISYRITDIDSLLFDGKYHKRFKGLSTNSLSYAPPDSYFIEGIGATGGIFYTNFVFIYEQVTQLLCFSGISTSIDILRDGVPLSNPEGMRDTISCNWVFTTDLRHFAYQSSDIKIYPNPSKGLFHVSIENSEQTEFVAHLSDISSREIKSVNLDGLKNDQLLDIGDLNAGIYLLTITKNKSIIYTTKLIKQE